MMKYIILVEDILSKHALYFQRNCFWRDAKPVFAGGVEAASGVQSPSDPHSKKDRLLLRIFKGDSPWIGFDPDMFPLNCDGD